MVKRYCFECFKGKITLVKHLLESVKPGFSKRKDKFNTKKLESIRILRLLLKQHFLISQFCPERSWEIYLMKKECAGDIKEKKMSFIQTSSGLARTRIPIDMFRNERLDSDS